MLLFLRAHSRIDIKLDDGTRHMLEAGDTLRLDRAAAQSIGTGCKNGERLGKQPRIHKRRGRT
ncbi:hypothetical protein [Caballeronia catudaia]|uniref:hypothetical protein n=1 Tax=Caballeronia catudaia TaxID=1777136 RepID=UPI00190EC10F|nr:hypothetical protein [Caballeronia catudaia]